MGAFTKDRRIGAAGRHRVVVRAFDYDAAGSRGAMGPVVAPRVQCAKLVSRADVAA